MAERFSYTDLKNPPVYRGQWAREPFSLDCTGKNHGRRSKHIPMGTWVFWIDSTMGDVLCLACAGRAGYASPAREETTP